MMVHNRWQLSVLLCGVAIPSIPNPMAMHNDYISALVETGLIGFIIFLLWHFRWFEELVEAYQVATSDFDRTATFAVLIVFASVMIMRITDNLLLDTYDMYPLCAMIAAVFSIPRIRAQAIENN